MNNKMMLTGFKYMCAVVSVTTVGAIEITDATKQSKTKEGTRGLKAIVMGALLGSANAFGDIGGDIDTPICRGDPYYFSPDGMTPLRGHAGCRAFDKKGSGWYNPDFDCATAVHQTSADWGPDSGLEAYPGVPLETYDRNIGKTALEVCYECGRCKKPACHVFEGTGFKNVLDTSEHAGTLYLCDEFHDTDPIHIDMKCASFAGSKVNGEFVFSDTSIADPYGQAHQYCPECLRCHEDAEK